MKMGKQDRVVDGMKERYIFSEICLFSTRFGVFNPFLRRPYLEFVDFI